eukprot:COSAG05_NODE_2714_length_2737_cov_140.062412_4_plen_77_part_00
MDVRGVPHSPWDDGGQLVPFAQLVDLSKARHNHGQVPACLPACLPVSLSMHAALSVCFLVSCMRIHARAPLLLSFL